MPPAHRVLGIDTSLRSTGVAVIEQRGSSFQVRASGIIRNPATRPHTACLAHLFESVRALIDEEKPGEVAIEDVFFAKNARTAMVLGQARGAVLAACSLAGVPVYEYAPRRVKQAVVGFGGAHKDQVGKMVSSMLGLKELPPNDISDAMALAICHLHQLRGPARGEPI